MTQTLLSLFRRCFRPSVAGSAFFQVFACVVALQFADADDEAFKGLSAEFDSTIFSTLESFCFDCHGAATQEAKLNLERFTSIADVAANHQLWAEVLARVEREEMPPHDSEQPSSEERKKLTDWIRAVRRSEAERTAGDPGSVPARRLSNAEYNYSIRDLTGVDIQPTKEFPVDPANEAGFDNSAESLSMSPGLFNKYLTAARFVAEHLVLKPDGFDFAPHPVVAETDRDKYCVKRIVEFYQRQPVDLADYFFAAWQYWVRDSSDTPDATLADLADANHVSSKYLERIWHDGFAQRVEIGPIATLQKMWQQLPKNSAQVHAARAQCEKMRDWVQEIRQELAPHFDNLDVEGIHKGAQAFVLWKNRQYADHRRKYDSAKLRSAEEFADSDRPQYEFPELLVPENEERPKYEAAIAQFCDLFPDAFFISERGRDYLGVARDEQEKGRLLSAGFHSMMGYFRDDQPLYDLILSEDEQRELDRLWEELDFIANAPARQYAGFLWFERTDSRFMRDPEFDFARPENKDAASEENIEKLSQVYLDKARRNGGEGVPIDAIVHYFHDMNRKIRWVESQRLAAEPSHLQDLLDFARRAYRRVLSEAEQTDLLGFYHALRSDGASHDDAVQDCIVSILVSPHFGYRMDLFASENGTRELTDNELASRLSYFLWGSMPDDELLALAANGTLHQREVLLAQTFRMLKDERFRGLATEFAGNWLDFRRFEEHNSVDREHFPQFTDDLRQAMYEEPIRFFIDVAQHDRSILDFLYSSSTIVSEELARHYGVQNFDPQHGAWQRVDVQHVQRGGLLPMAVFQTMNAPGLRTSPVKRGYWVVRRLLGETIPPPPPNVPELPKNEADLGTLTLSEVLAQHRAHESCAGCHDRFDSIGLVFENFGPIGELRQVDLGGRPIETSVTFPSGSQGTGLGGLQDYLRSERETEFVENFCSKLLSYALGRTLQLSDEILIEEMQHRLADNEFRFETVIENIVTSPQFLHKRGGTSLVKD